MAIRRLRKTPAIALTIAGSDPSGGAGIQADLKTFAAFGVHGLSVITAVTAQHTRAVMAIQIVSTAQVVAQLEAVFADFRVAAVKIGMLGNAANTRAVARFLRWHRVRHIVLDPVMVASSGKRLLDGNALAVLRAELVPLAEVLTPNLPEAEALLQRRLDHRHARPAAARDLRALGAGAVLLKGGHHAGAGICDYWADVDGVRKFRHPRLTIQVHGTGCTLASAIAAGLALGWTRRQAATQAERYLQAQLRDAFPAGKGAIHLLDHMGARRRN